MLKTVKQFISDEKGLETVEYAVMTALVVAGMVAAITALSAAIVGQFNDTADTITNIGGG